MIKIVWPALFALTFSLNLFSSEKRLLEIEQQTTYGESIYVVGDHPYLGNLDIKKALKLSPKKYPHWEINAWLPTDKPIRYRFLKKSDVPKISSYEWLGEWHSFSQSEGLAKLGKPVVNSDKYKLHIIKNIHSKYLSEDRDVFIFFPENISDQQKIKIFYFHDGQNLFSEYSGPMGSLDLDHWFPDFIHKETLDNVIIVGIGNSKMRMQEYLPPYSTGPDGKGLGDLYGKFISEELIPTVETGFLKLNPIVKAQIERGLAGASLGGIISLYLATQYPETFSSVLSMSGTYSFREIARDLDKLTAKIYLDNGTEGDNFDNYFENYFIRDELLDKNDKATKKYIFGKNLMHSIGIGHEHNESSWRARLPEAFQWILKEN